MIKKLILIILFLGVSEAWAATYYVRTDGGTGTQCTGLANAAYDGSGTGEACAFNHPNWALEGQGQPAGAMAGSDTLVLACPNNDCTGVSYRIGCLDDADCVNSNYNTTNTATCFSSWSYDCYPNAVPSGTSGTHTKIIGCSTGGCSGYTGVPKLWGAGRVVMVLNLGGSQYVDVQDIEITDHADCGEGHPLYNCGTADSSELSARDLVYLEGAENITFNNVYLHGAWRYGAYGGNVSNITWNNSRIEFNARGGWNLDTCNNDGTCGVNANGDDVIFSGSLSGTRYTCKINNNGCVEDSASVGTAKSQGCYEQTASGYGDGIGSSRTTGDWSFTGCEIMHNTSDGIDLLYSLNGITLAVKKSRIEGNNGNQLKGPNTMDVQASYIIGNCGYFYGQSFTYGVNDWAKFDFCRALGNTIAIAFINSTIPKIIGTTVTGNGDVLIQTSGICTTGQDVTVKNNVLLGGREFRDDTSVNAAGGNDSVSVYYDAAADCAGLNESQCDARASDGCDWDGSACLNCDTDFVETNNVCISFKEGSSACNGTDSNDTATSSQVFDGTIKQGPYTSPGYYTSADYVDQLDLKSGSPAIDIADETVTGAETYDYFGITRPASWDSGALEFNSGAGGGTSDRTGIMIMTWLLEGPSK